jgi:Ca-activated chloride channel family protein
MTTPNERFDDALDKEAKLTAYALGELDEREATELETRLEQDAELRGELEAIRATTSRLEAALAGEVAPGLTPEQHARIERGEHDGNAGGDAPPVIYSFTARRFWAGVGLAAAACVVLAIWLPMIDSSGDDVAIDLPAPEETESDEIAGAEMAVDLETLKEKKLDALRQDTRRKGELSDLANRSVEPAADPAWASASSSEGYREIEAKLPSSKPHETASKAGEAGGKMDQPTRPSPSGGGSIFGDPGADRDRDDSAAASRRMRRAAPSQDSAAAPPPGPGTGPGFGGGSGGGDVYEGLSGRTSDGRAQSPGAIARAVAPAPPPVPAIVDRGRGRAPHRVAPPSWSRENFQQLVDNPFRNPLDEGAALSTLSTDVDTASYANVRRYLNQGALPPADAVRIEEMINYFDYDYPAPVGEHPFAVDMEVGSCPWTPEHRLVRIGLQAQEIELEERPSANVVFLLDVSGSMRPANKLPLVQESMRMLVEELGDEDRVAIVTYAGTSGLALPSTYCSEKEPILAAIDGLRAGGSTNGAGGIEMAYEIAQSHLIDGGVNRVILCTDGDFNVGVTSDGDLVRLIEQKRTGGVFLTVLGFGTGNFQDGKMEQITNAGNGNFAYIDSRLEARKVLVEELSGTLVTVAKDVKFQVDFNPARVGAYRLIGYANRLLAPEDFNDDAKDAGDVGAGHAVTVLYEIVPPDVMPERRSVEPSQFQKPRQPEPDRDRDLVDDPAMLVVRLRYKSPEGGASTLAKFPLIDDGVAMEGTSEDFQFAGAVAAFGMILRDSPYRAGATFGLVQDLAAGSAGDEPNDRRAEFMALVDRAAAMRGEVPPIAPASFD